ncbi:PepSY domain-containing protein [Flavihumibacter stibioxidans]|uniref:DNA mismatch repair protein n=1 Tax=Flavihumibacter stibioxidans TaxID=1834163 RepID=A0ABR7MAT9_9BACT|nr:PepSY-associated TM helix domain-containing protein [Flavihumibacter stibioxidans]MBC6491678.1 DNA mismatch repair protein [Flavihumibacter stibioxidans]
MSRSSQAKILRLTRKVHRLTGIALFIFFILVGLTGAILGWKKNSGGYLLATTSTGTSSDSKSWLPLDSLNSIAMKHYIGMTGNGNNKIDRIDVRPDKGIAKMLFLNGYDAIQVDLATGAILKEEKRRGDFIEHIHDGTYMDEILGLNSGIFKLIYTTLMGLALVLFSVSGFWLWYGPKQMRKHSS